MSKSKLKSKSTSKTKSASVSTIVAGIDIDQYRELPSKSAQIRAMAATGAVCKDITKAMQALYGHHRYQFTRNVLNNPIKRSTSATAEQSAS